MFSLNILKRETSKKSAYLSYIDGLKFLAIFHVVGEHFKLYYVSKVHEVNIYVENY